MLQNLTRIFMQSEALPQLQAQRQQAPWLIIVRDLHKFRFYGDAYSKKPDVREQLSRQVFEFSDKVGIDACGAYYALATGPAHENINDKKEPWDHVATAFFTEKKEKIIFEDANGTEWDRLRVGTDMSNWYPQGTFRIKRLQPATTREKYELDMLDQVH